MSRIRILLVFFTIFIFSNTQVNAVSFTDRVQINDTLKKVSKKMNNFSINLDSIAKLEKEYINEKKWHQLIQFYYQIAKKYFKTKNHDLAVKYYLKIDSIAKDKQILSKITVKSIRDRSEISKLKFTYDAVELADDLSREALLKAEKLKDSELIADIKLLLSEILFLKKEKKKALEFLKESSSYFKKNDNPVKMSRIYLLNMMHFKNNLKDYKKTDSIIREGIEYLKTKQQPKKLADLHIFYADFLIDEIKDTSKALKHYIKADSIFYNKNKISELHHVYLLEGLSHCYNHLGQYKKALYFNQKAYDFRKELYRRHNRELSRRLEIQYQAQQKEALLKNKMIQNKLLKKQNYLFILLSILFFLLGITLYIQYKNRQKVVQKLKELDKAKSNFFANISHEFRTPLTLILSPVKAQLKQNNLSKEDQNLFKIIKQNAERLLDLINQVLDISKLDAGKKQIKVSQVKLQDFLSYIVHNFDSLAESNNLSFLVEINCIDKQGWIDKDVLQKIVNNLLSNSFKYTNINEGKIMVKVFCDTNFLTINIKNTGKELSQQDLNKIFERFYQKDYHSDGIGLGLSIVKKMVELHKGSINVQSKDGWTVFKVKIPISKNTYKENEIVYGNETEKNKNTQETPIQVPVKTKECPIDKLDDPILLVIEDNKDIQNYVKNIFSDCFKVITADDGNEGIEKIQNYVPDIIICDVMIPGIDGIALCKGLKSCLKTNHIPIIMLTAKVGEENKIKGLSAGADDYIEKPFNEDILKLKVKNLIQSRKTVREKITNDLSYVINIPENIPDNDQNFLRHLKQIVEEHITNPEFTTDKFAELMNMSRMQLHRKLKALTGFSTSKFILSQRLKIAAKMLVNKEVNISEIAYQVGFSDPSYFNRCFKKQFGKTPSEYKQ